MKRLILTFLLLVCAVPSFAQRQNIYSTKAIKEFEQALTAGTLFGVPRYTTVALPTCDSTQTGAIAFNTTTVGLTTCDGIGWVSGGGAGSVLPIVLDNTGAGNGVETFRKTPSGSSQTSNFFSVTGTMPTMTTLTWANRLLITGSGNANQVNSSFDVEYLAGYTGTGSNTAIRAANFTAGTGTAYVSGYDTASGPNEAVLGRSVATTAGANVGMHGQASGGSINAGAVFAATASNNSGTNVGAVILGRNTGTSPTYTGLYVGNGSEASPTIVNSALQVNNADQTSPIQVSQNNGTSVDVLQGGGSRWASMSAKALTESAATLFVRVDVPSNGRQGGVVEYCVDADDGTEFQSRCGSVSFAAANKATVETCTTGTPADAIGASSGTLTVSFDTETAGTNQCGIRANATSSLTQTTLRIDYTVRLFGNAATAATAQ